MNLDGPMATITKENIKMIFEMVMERCTGSTRVDTLVNGLMVLSMDMELCIFLTAVLKRVILKAIFS